MKRLYVYIITRDMKLFHIGYTKEIVKCVEKYKGLISLFYPKKPNLLVYLEELPGEDLAKVRTDEIMSLTKAKKIKLIESVNPDWVELIIGQNIQL